MESKSSAVSANVVLDVKLAAIAVLLSASTVFGHDMWLAPDSYLLSDVRELDYSIRIGEGLRAEETREIEPEMVTRFDLYQRGETIDLKPVVEGTTGLPPLARGTFVVAMERKPAVAKLSAKKFNAYLEEEAHEKIVALRRKNRTLGKDAVERFSRHLKSIGVVGEPDGDVSHLFGQKLEIVPLASPVATPRPAILPVRLLFEGRSVTDQRISLVVRRSDGSITASHTRTDAEGIAQFRLESAGEALLRATYMQPCAAGCAGADYESFWSAVSFSIPSN